MWFPSSRNEYLAHMRGSAIVLVILLAADWFWKGFGFSEIWYLWILVALAAPFIGVNFVAPD
jgi:low affinity Fe/Cu permease